MAYFIVRPQNDGVGALGVSNASQHMFGCLWQVLCGSHGPARSTPAKKTTHNSSSFVHIVVVLCHHVGLEGRARARMVVVVDRSFALDVSLL